MTASLSGQIIVNGLMLAGFYILVASGLTILMGSIKILTLAQGAMCMLGGYALYSLLLFLHLPYVLALILAGILVGLFGAASDNILLRKYRQKFLVVSNVTLGIWLISESGISLYFGGYPISVPPLMPGVINIGGIIFSWERVLLIIAAAVLMCLLFLFLYYTKLGRATRAIGYHFEAARLCGVRPDSIAALVMFIGTGFAGWAGALAAPIFTIDPYGGFAFLVRSIMVVLLGGLGSIPGAMIAGLVIGMLDSVAATLIGPTMATMVIFALVMIIILIKPAGLMGIEYELYFE